MRTSEDWALNLLFAVIVIVMIYCLWLAPLMGW